MRAASINGVVVDDSVPTRIYRVIRQLQKTRPFSPLFFTLGRRDHFPKYRNLAYCTGRNIVIAPKLTRRPIATIRAIIAHEIAHAVMWNQRHSERQCDAKAEQLFGIKIYYDKRDVQTTTYRRGYQRPRPLHLPK